MVIFTDGAYKHNRGAFSVLSLEHEPKIYFGLDEAVDNNQVELAALIFALELAQKEDTRPIITTDYMNAITGTRNQAKSTHQQFWQRFWELEEKVHPVWQFVEGHSGNRYNCFCDRVARTLLRNLPIPKRVTCVNVMCKSEGIKLGTYMPVRFNGQLD